MTKKSKSGKSVKKAAADEQEVADIEQGATEELEEAKPVKKAPKAPAKKEAEPEVKEEIAAKAEEPAEAAGKCEWTAGTCVQGNETIDWIPDRRTW